MQKIIDFRSDTFTKPSDAMREVMAKAEVGDDVYKEDESVNELENYACFLTEKEAAIFMPSGTMSNLSALLSHCQRGEEYICGQEAHCFKFEAGGAAVFGSIQPQPIEFEDDGSLDLQKVKQKIKFNDFHFAKTKLLCLENTHNGKVLSLDYMQKAYEFTRKHGLKLHLDGARIFNAAVELNVEVSKMLRFSDSVTICLSKGLGAPVGSLLVGSSEFIENAKRWRKMLGGGLRQSGIIASGGLFALKNHVNDLKKDHLHAKILADELKKLDFLKLISNDTNMLFFEMQESEKFINYLKRHNILIAGYGMLRMVTHRDISFEDIQKTIEIFKDFKA